jgi:hypothetical protein
MLVPEPSLAFTEEPEAKDTRVPLVDASALNFTVTTTWSPVRGVIDARANFSRPLLLDDSASTLYADEEV